MTRRDNLIYAQTLTSSPSKAKCCVTSSTTTSRSKDNAASFVGSRDGFVDTHSRRRHAPARRFRPFGAFFEPLRYSACELGHICHQKVNAGCYRDP